MVRGGWLRLAVAGVVMVSVTMTTATAAVVAPASAVTPTAGRPGPGGTSPRSPFPGFVLERGRYTSIEAPDPDVWLFPFDINNRGQLTGEYVRVGPDGIPYSESGFVRDKRGRVTVLDIPGAKGTEAVKLNDRGQAVGEYSQDTPIVNDSANPRDYLWDRGRVTIEIPGADPVRTEPLGLNNRGQVVGLFDDPVTMAGARVPAGQGGEGARHADQLPGAPGTIATGINDQGQIVGFYENPNAAPSRQPTGGQPQPGIGRALTSR